MRFAELLEQPRALLAAAISAQWTTTLVVALRGAEISLGAVELLNVFVLGPVALVAGYRIGGRIGGVALAAWTLLVWVATPWTLHILALAQYDTTVRDHVLPLALGLTSEPGYAAGVLLLSAVALLSARRTAAAAAAGVAGGAAIVLVPEAFVFLVPVAVALLVAWRPADLTVCLATASPALLVLALWRQPAFGDLSVEALNDHFAGLREYFWSQRLLQWLPLAGVVAVARRSAPLALLLGGWLAAWVATGATRAGTGFENGELFRVLLPALPAYVLLAAALPLLVPTLAARLGPLARPVET